MRNSKVAIASSLFLGQALAALQPIHMKVRSALSSALDGPMLTE